VQKIIREILVLLWKAFRLVLWKWLRMIFGKLALYSVVVLSIVALIVFIFARGG
jgi:hypothetical protein